MKLTKFPRKLKIWGHEYRVLKQKDPKTFDGNNSTSVLGWCSNNEQAIAIKTSMPASREAEVLLHEVLHAVAYNTGLFWTYPNKHDLEEHVVDTIANGIILVLKDNPTLIDYFKENLHGTEERKED